MRSQAGLPVHSGRHGRRPARHIFSPPHELRAADRARMAAHRFRPARDSLGVWHLLRCSVLNIAVAPLFNPPFLNVLVYPTWEPAPSRTSSAHFRCRSRALSLVRVARLCAMVVCGTGTFRCSERSPPACFWTSHPWEARVPTCRCAAMRINPNRAAEPAYPQFGAFDLYESVGSSSYHSFQFKAQKRVARGLSFLAAYTFSKSIDDASGIFPSRGDPAFPQDSNNLALDRGLSNFDARHRFALTSCTNCLSRAEILAGRLEFGWNSDHADGPAVHREPGRRPERTGSATVSSSDRPNQIADPFRAGPVPGNPDPACRQTVSQGGRAADVVRDPASWINPCAFAPAPGQFGTRPNSLRDPAFASLDFHCTGVRTPVRTAGSNFAWSSSTSRTTRISIFRTASSIPPRSAESSPRTLTAIGRRARFSSE